MRSFPSGVNNFYKLGICTLSTNQTRHIPQLTFNRIQTNLSIILQRNFSKSIETKSGEEKNVQQAEDEAEDDILYRSIQIEARSADQGVLDSYQKFVTMAANNLGITISRTWKPFRTIKRRTLLRSAFVKKKYRVQYEFRTYYRNMEFKHLTGSTADTFLEYIERNLPEGTALKVIRERIEAIPSHLNASGIPVANQ